MFSVIAPPNQLPQTRRAHRKSREGCRTCKFRRLKCDEAKPVCGNCAIHFVGLQACDYGSGKIVSKPKTARSRRKDGEKGAEAELEMTKKSSASSSLLDEELSRGSSLPQSIDGQLLDPFLMHPPSVVKGVDFLMKYYLQTAVYQSFPWQPPSVTNPTTTYFVPLMLNDTVLFHAILRLSYTRLQAQCFKLRDEVSGFQLMGETVRLLRERVEGENDDPGIGVSDQTISAVATLAAVEHERGDLKMLKMHLGGLNRMIELRGGLNAIRETNPMVANSVFWIFVVAMYEVPFPSLDPVLHPFFPGDHGLMSPFVRSHFEDIAPGSSDPPSMKYASLGLIQPVASVLNSVQHVSQLVPTHDAYPSASASLVILTRLCTLLSYLLSLPLMQELLQGCDSPESRFSASISECTRLAILLHIFRPWRGLPPDGTLTINHLLHRLIDSVKDLLTSPMTRANVLILWIFAVGAITSFGLPERRWFVSHLREITDEMGMETWEDMKVCLRQGIWHEKLCEGPYRALWDAIVASKMILLESDL